jgi:hypothetical protein
MAGRIFQYFVASMLLMQLAYAQATREWVNRFNGADNRFDISNSLKLDASSNVYVYGSSASTTTTSDIAIIKYSSAGNVLWTRLFNGYGNSIDEINSSYLDDSGNSFICGYTADTSQVIKVITQKYNTAGTLLWSRVFLPPAYNQGYGNSITVSPSGDVYSASSLRRSNGSYVIAVLKYSQDGIPLDTAYFSKTAASTEAAVTVCTDNSGAVYLLGKTNAVSGADDILMLKYDGALNLEWQNTFSGTAVGSDIPVQMLISKDNKIVVCAGMRNLPGGLDYGLYRFDTNAALIMIYRYNGTGNDQDLPYSVTCDSANNIYVTGSSRNADTLGSEDFYTIKLDPTSQVLWEKRYNGTGRGLDYGTSVAVDRFGNVYAGGCTDKHENHIGYAVLKYGPTGDLLWLEEYSRLELSEDFVYTVAVDNSLNVFVTGISFDSTTDYDIATIKYSQAIGVQNISNEIPEGFELHSPYPNPFNPGTTILFDIPQTGNNNIMLEIYDTGGKLVEILAEGFYLPGRYKVKWDAGKYSSGIYFCRMVAGKYRFTHKIVLAK